MKRMKWRSLIVATLLLALVLAGSTVDIQAKGSSHSSSHTSSHTTKSTSHSTSTSHSSRSKQTRDRYLLGDGLLFVKTWTDSSTVL